MGRTFPQYFNIYFSKAYTIVRTHLSVSELAPVSQAYGKMQAWLLNQLWFISLLTS